MYDSAPWISSDRKSKRLLFVLKTCKHVNRYVLKHNAMPDNNHEKKTCISINYA
jgi:hypothetical protein